MAKRPELPEVPEGFDYLPPVAGALAASSLAEMGMHVVARSALLNILVSEDPDVDALFGAWTKGTAAGRAASRLVEVADAAALAASTVQQPQAFRRNERKYDSSAVSNAKQQDQIAGTVAGISSHVRPCKIRPVRFFCTPPHCLKKKATPAETH